MSAPESPAISLIVMAIGPERVVARAIETAIRQTTPLAELVVVHDRDDAAALARLGGYLGGKPATLVPARGMSPGAARNAGVRSSKGACFLVVDGSEAFDSDHVTRTLQALETEPDASFAAADGGALFGVVRSSSSSSPSPRTIDATSLVGGAWSVGPAVVRRRAFDAPDGFDEVLPALVDWDFLLTLVDAGKTGVRVPGPGSRCADDDVRLRESLAAQCHLPAMRRIFARHQRTFEKLMRVALVERDRTVKALFDHERTLLARREQTVASLDRTLEQIAGIRPELSRNGLRTLDFADLRRTSPVSRNWGSERGRPVDRHYIHRFLSDQADDVRGQVLEMLDAELTTTYGGDRVERSDVLDIDPGNARATVIADLRVAEQLPADAYDCFILTQTLHLIDDMQAALRTAYRLLKPGGVLLVTLPCASMVAVEYGPKGDHWRVTEAGARALFEGVFNPPDLSIRAHGNVLTIAAFLYGLCCDDLDPGEFAVDDPAYPLLITIRAQKPAAAARRVEAVPGQPSAAAVLLYHRVAAAPHDHHALAVSPEAFRSQVQHLCESWRVLPLRTLAAAAASGDLPERGIALTFDDGYVDNLEIAAPILAELGVPATFYLTSESLATRRRFWWDVLEEMVLWSDRAPERIELRLRGQRRTFATSLPAERRAVHDELYGIFKTSAPVVRDDLLLQLARQTSVPLVSDAQRPMLADEVRRLGAFPLIDVGAHTVHHLSLPQLPVDEIHREISESRSALERLIGQPVTSFAYPFGDVSPEAAAAVMAAGFRDAVSCEPRGLRAREHPLRIPRLPTREESGAELGARLARLLQGGAEVPA